MVGALVDGIGQTASAPGLFLEDITVPVSNKVANLSPGLVSLVLAEHGAEDGNKLVVTQKTLLTILA